MSLCALRLAVGLFMPDDVLSEAQREAARACIRERIVVDASGCWIWQRGGSGDGYGCSWFEGGHGVARRLSYLVFVGEIAAGLEVGHLCRVRRCVSRARMELVTQRVNSLRGVGVLARNAATTHCVRGRRLVGSSVRVLSDARGRVGRRCLVCGAEWRREYRARGGFSARVAGVLRG